jgi:hypothetical protein
MRVVERIGPLAPAFATVGASVCVSSLLLTTVPHALGPSPGVPPLKGETRPASVTVSPLKRLVPHGQSRVARAAGHPIPAGPSRASTTSTPSSPSVPTQISPIGTPSPTTTPPPPALPSPTPAPPAASPPVSVTVATPPTDKRKPAKDTSKPGWGHGDPNHDHTGPPGKGSKDQKSQPTPPVPAPPASQPPPPVAAPPATPGAEHGSPQSGKKKSEGR